MAEVRFRLASTLGLALACTLIGCGSSGHDSKANPAGGGSSGTTPPGNNTPPATTPTIPVPNGGVSADKADTTLKLTQAADLGDVKYIPNRSSVRLYLPGIDGARDYRVFAVDDPSVSVTSTDDKREHLVGATMFCAGLRQRNQCDDGEVLPIKYNNPLLDSAVCEAAGDPSRRPNVPTQLMQTLEVNGLKAKTTLVVEAIDRQCPFPGLLATTHLDERIANVDVGPAMSQANINDKSYTLKLLPDTYPVRTEMEMRAQYDSMIFNGQGPNLPTLDVKSPSFPESPYIRIGYPAAADDPVVLARSVVTVTPSGDDKLPDGFTDQDYFDDFDDDTDQPTLLRNTDPAMDIVGGHMNVYTTKKWVLYDVNNQFSDFFVDRGQLNEVMGDPDQDSMSVQGMYPKRPVQIPTAADQYLHVTYEVQRIETARRYENLTLCGSDEMGKTYTGETPAAAPVPHPGFMDGVAIGDPTVVDTNRSSTLGWNCLMLVARGAGYYGIPGGDVMSHSDTSLKITLIKKQTPPKDFTEYDTHITGFGTSFGPNQDPAFTALWERQVDGSGQPSGVWLDDQLNVLQRTRFDVFIRRDKVVIYVEGQQRVCQDLDPTLMTMAEGALGFWHILYHTSAEFGELRQAYDSADPKTGLHHVIHNEPFADERKYDNVGFRENVSLPADFDTSLCLPAKPPGK